MSLLRIHDHDFSANYGPTHEVEVEIDIEPATNPVDEIKSITENEAESSESLPELDGNNVQISQLFRNTVSVKKGPRIEKPTATKKGSTPIFSGAQYEAVVLSRSRKASGKRKHWCNFHIKETDEIMSIDVSCIYHTIDDYTIMNKDEVYGFG